MTLRCELLQCEGWGCQGGASYQPVWFKPSGSKGGSFIKTKVHSAGLCVPEAGSHPRGRPGVQRGLLRTGPLSWEGLGRGLTSLEFLQVSLWRPVRKSSSACWAHRCSLWGGRGRGAWEGEEEERNGQGRGVPGRRQPRPPAWGEAGCSVGSRVKGRAGPQLRARPPPTLLLHPTQCVPGTVPSGNSPNSPADRRELLLLHPF